MVGRIKSIISKKIGKFQKIFWTNFLSILDLGLPRTDLCQAIVISFLGMCLLLLFFANTASLKSLSA